MPGVDDLEIRSVEPEQSFEPPEPEIPTGDGDGDGRWAIVAVAAVAALALAATAYFLYGTFFGGEAKSPAPPPAPVVEAPSAEEPAAAATEPPPPTPEPFRMPPLDASDAVVRQLVGTLSSHPGLVEWLVNDELVRRFVRTVANVTYGENPRAHLEPLAPDGSFAVREVNGVLQVDPRSWERYDPLVDVFVSLDNDGVARLYRRLRPLLQSAYDELGYPDRSFDRVLQRAIDGLLSVPDPSPELEVRERVISYEYADPELEELSAPQKHFLRLGPANVRRVKAKLRELSRALALG